ncbi:hypothetical protein CRG98_046497 [Punica granatum]|uniref:Uncharacterized protein n=1 Tax=Punica granatum TaxID=22663 RepID=A0A2I0HNS0_PUNGR|nr:hypothetical protein CRG98_046497 [Punica granatum]
MGYLSRCSFICIAHSIRPLVHGRPPAPKFPQLRLSLPLLALTLSLAETRSSFFLLLPQLVFTDRGRELDLTPENRGSTSHPRPAAPVLPSASCPTPGRPSPPLSLSVPRSTLTRLKFFFFLPQPGPTAQKPSPWSAAARPTSSSPAAAIKQRPSPQPRPYSVQQACSAQSSPVHPHRISTRHGPAQLVQHFNFFYLQNCPYSSQTR